MFIWDQRIAFRAAQIQAETQILVSQFQGEGNVLVFVCLFF